jgi:hypothetical protein
MPLTKQCAEREEKPSRGRGRRVVEAKIFWEWLRGLDSNQDNQLQRLACYQLHYPGPTPESVADKGAKCFQRIRSPARSLMGWLQFVTLENTQLSGEVSEWFKEHAWKACVGETQPWVRIPPSPPTSRAFSLCSYHGCGNTDFSAQLARILFMCVLSLRLRPSELAE